MMCVLLLLNRNRRINVVLLAFAMMLGSAHRMQQIRQQTSIDWLYAAYISGDYQIIERTVTGEQLFEQARADLDHAVVRWKSEWRPVQAAFILDLALVGQMRKCQYWVDVLDTGRRFVMARPDPPGRVPKYDAFEIAWHKTAVALLGNSLTPDLVEKHGIDPLDQRLKPEAESREACLVDPWIELIRGVIQEERTIAQPDSLGKVGPVALRHFDYAAKYDNTRAEAIVRKSFVLIRLGRASEALVALQALGDHIDDSAVLYWSRLFLGRALERLERLDDAVRAYESALTIVPRAQVAFVALATLELRRNRSEQSLEWAAAARTVPLEMTDPWWEYRFADHRFLQARLRGLREASR